MTPENFCYWINGLLEMQPDLKSMSKEQVQMIRDHLKLVFKDGKKTAKDKEQKPEEDKFCAPSDMNDLLKKLDQYVHPPFKMSDRVIC